jgi:hypothetical protein
MIADVELTRQKQALGEVGWQAAALSGEMRDLQQYVSVMEATLKSQTAAGECSVVCLPGNGVSV